MSIALIPGSFDPITLGHVNVIERAAKVFDKVYVAVMYNDSAKYAENLSSKKYLFTLEERLEMIKLSVSHLENVEALSASGLLIDLFERLGADCIVKGLRNAADLEYELIHAKWNKAHDPRAETVFLPADEQYDGLSSTLVRELLAKGDHDALHGKVSENVIEFLKNRKI